MNSRAAFANDCLFVLLCKQRWGGTQLHMLSSSFIHCVPWHCMLISLIVAMVTADAQRRQPSSAQSPPTSHPPQSSAQASCKCHSLQASARVGHSLAIGRVLGNAPTPSQPTAGYWLLAGPRPSLCCCCLLVPLLLLPCSPLLLPAGPLVRVHRHQKLVQQLGRLDPADVGGVGWFVCVCGACVRACRTLGATQAAE